MSDALLDRPFVNRMGLRPGVITTQLTVKSIMFDVCERFGLTVAQITSRQQSGPLARARHEAFYLCRTLTQASTTEIGRIFNKDHSSVIYGADRHAKRIGAVNGNQGSACSA